jgi:hypothetical protein
MGRFNRCAMSLGLITSFLLINSASSGRDLIHADATSDVTSLPATPENSNVEVAFSQPAFLPTGDGFAGNVFLMNGHGGNKRRLTSDATSSVGHDVN